MRNHLTCLVVASPLCSTECAPSLGSRPHHSQALCSCSQLLLNLRSAPRSLLVCFAGRLLEELDNSGIGLQTLSLCLSKQVSASAKLAKFGELVIEDIE